MDKVRGLFEGELNAAEEIYYGVVEIGVRDLEDAIKDSILACFTKHFHQPAQDFVSPLADFVESILALVGERLNEYFATGRLGGG